MDSTPKSLTKDELSEIAAFEPLWELWGAENAEDMLEVLKGSYCVRFDFMSGSPGYVGDLFIIQGDALTDARPIELNRDKDGKLQLVDYSY